MILSQATALVEAARPSSAKWSNSPRSVEITSPPPYTWRFALGPFVLISACFAMTTHNADAPSQKSPPAAPQTSPIRLVILLALLALVIAAYAYDFLVAKPGVEAAEKKIDAFVESRNRLGVKDSSLVTAADIQKEIGMKPTWVEKHDDDNYEVEYYCWWGPVPGLNMRRHFISIVYVGGHPRRFSSQHRNEKPPREALPIPDETAVVATDESLPPLESAGGKKKRDTDTAKDSDAPAAKDADAAPAKETNPTPPGEVKTDK